MSRSPLYRRQVASIIGMACVVAMPSFAVGSAFGEPSSPATPTTTVIPEPPPVEQPEIEQSELPSESATVPPEASPDATQSQDAPPSSDSSVVITETVPAPDQQLPLPDSNEGSIISPEMNNPGNIINLPQFPESVSEGKGPVSDSPTESMTEIPRPADESHAETRIFENGEGPPLDFSLPNPETDVINDRSTKNGEGFVQVFPEPLPPDNGNFPDWGYDPPQVGSLPVIVSNHNPIPRCREDYNECLPPPIVPDEQWHNSWTEQCGFGSNHSNSHPDCQPPSDPNIFVINGDDNEVVIVNNVVNQSATNLFVTNLDTGSVYDFPYVPHGRPFAFPAGWCGGVGGSFAWSAGVHGHSAGVTFGGGGVFNADAQCGFVPPPRPHAPLVIATTNNYHYTTDDYVELESCGCVYVSNTYIYGHRQGRVFVPTSWTPDIVTQPARQGLPPFLTGQNPVENRAIGTMSWTKALTEPLFIIGLSIAFVSLATLIYLKRQRTVQ